RPLRAATLRSTPLGPPPGSRCGWGLFFALGPCQPVGTRSGASRRRVVVGFWARPWPGAARLFGRRHARRLPPAGPATSTSRTAQPDPWAQRAPLTRLRVREGEAVRAWSVPLAVIALLCDGRPRPSADQRPHPSEAQGGVSGASVAPPADSPGIRSRGARIFSPSAVPPHQKEEAMTE